MRQLKQSTVIATAILISFNISGCSGSSDGANATNEPNPFIMDNYYLKKQEVYINNELVSSFEYTLDISNGLIQRNDALLSEKYTDIEYSFDISNGYLNSSIIYLDNNDVHSNQRYDRDFQGNINFFRMKQFKEMKAHHFNIKIHA